MIKKALVAIIATLWSGLAIAAFNTTPVPYPTHAELLSAVNANIGARIEQSGFTASGDGGAATYFWNALSYCPGGTSGTPVTADGIVCILPTGQSASTAGRYLMQVSGSLDVRAIGMAPGGQDNYPFVAALMNALSPTAALGASEAVSPGIPGQPTTYYYFSQPLVLSVTSKFRCVGPLNGYVTLYFGSGYDGVVATAENDFNGCRVANLGFAEAYINPLSTAVTANGTSGGPLMYFLGIPGVTPGFHVGDGIIASGRSSFYLVQAFPPIVPGTTVSAVNGDGSLVLSQLPNQFFAADVASWSTTPLRSTAVFTGSGTNFVNNDTINVAGTTYTFVTTLGGIQHSVLIGTNYQATAANLVAAVNNTKVLNVTGSFLTYTPSTGTTPGLPEQKSFRLGGV